MKTPLRHGFLLISVSLTLAKDVDLPLCPTNLQYFPQNLPMHCRMPGNSQPNQNQGYPGMQQFATMPPMSPPYYQSPPPDKQPQPIPIPIPPFPGMPGSMQMPGGMGPPGMPGMPPPGMPGPMPMPMPMVGGPPHKLPVIVMPFYSPDNSFKRPGPGPSHRDPNKKSSRKKRKKSYDSDEGSSGDTSSGDNSDASHSSDEHGWWQGHKKSSKRKAARRFMRHHKSKKRKDKKKKDLLTPILQYVTKDGYVIFEKKISKNEAKDWLKPKNDARAEEEVKNEENNVIQVVQKSAEQTPKPEVEEMVLRAEEKSAEEVTERESTTMAPQPRLHVRKHRQRKVNDLINQPGLEP